MSADTYTAESMAAQIKEPQDRIEAVRPALEALGAKILAGGFPFGEYDVLVVYEAPDDTTAASVAMAVAAGGAVRSSKTTRLLSGQEWTESLRNMGLDGFVAWLLEAGGPVNILGAQLLYIGQPFATRQAGDGIRALANLLEQEDEARAFAALLKGQSS